MKDLLSCTVTKASEYKNNEPESPSSICQQASDQSVIVFDEERGPKDSLACPQIPDFLAFPYIIGYTFSPAMNSKQLVVGLDGGGTKTEAILADPSGTILS